MNIFVIEFTVENLTWLSVGVMIGALVGPSIVNFLPDWLTNWIIITGEVMEEAKETVEKEKS